MTFEVRIDIDAIEFVNSQSDKSRRIIETQLKNLEDDPFPGKGGDKELLNLHQGARLYRLHIGRSFTVFYEVEDNIVYVNKIMTIEQAHKKYSWL
ncbi:MAG: type II toxin-antitoxin system RelE/ParE family toxin [Methanoregula sp.]|nr:type II toxin-antitoxin system RelE/ParE family toxin [Methanoregula sp.]